MGKILVIEDEKSINRFIRINLEREGFKVACAFSGEEGLEMTRQFKPDVMVLDLMLPGIDGFEVCTRTRELNPEVIIIILTAKGQDMDKIMGLELGADDYMIKPFNPQELAARIRAHLRRYSTNDETENAGFMINERQHKIYKNGEVLALSPKEYEIMSLLIKNPNRTFSRHELLDHVWGVDYIGDIKTVDVHICRLREKIEKDIPKECYIETVWGYGYKWQGNEP